MKKILLLSAFLVFGLTAATAQETAAAKKVTTTEVKKTKKAKKAKKSEVKAPEVKGPGIVFENETIDYGTIDQKADGQREFVFTNNGDQPLEIKSAVGSCGCTVPEAPKGQIAPGAKGVIKVKYDTNRVGVFTKNVTVTTNASETPKVLMIKGNVKATETTPATPATTGTPATPATPAAPAVQTKVQEVKS